MAERHISFEQLSDVMAFRAIVPDAEDCYRALGVIHSRWPMVPGRFKDYVSTPKRNGYRSLHTSVIQAEKMRIEIQMRSQARCTRQAEHGFAAHWSLQADAPRRPMGTARWIQDLVEILDHADSAEELLEHTRMAMYQDRIFAFTPKGELIQLPKGATPVDFAYAIHTNLGDTSVGAKINGRVVPLRTQIENGDQVQILQIQGAGAAAVLAQLCGHGQGARRDPPLRAPQGTRRTDRAGPQDLSTRSSRACRHQLGQGAHGASDQAPEAARREAADGRDRAAKRDRRAADGCADAGIGAGKARWHGARRSARRSRSRG